MPSGPVKLPCIPSPSRWTTGLVFRAMLEEGLEPYFRVQGQRDGLLEYVLVLWCLRSLFTTMDRVQLTEKLPNQTHFRSIVTDEQLRVKGSDGSIYAFGDAATIEQVSRLETMNA